MTVDFMRGRSGVTVTELGEVTPPVPVTVRLLAVDPPELRLALRPEEAATALGISRDALDEHVLPELRVVRRGRLKLIPVRELEKWLDREARRALEGER